MGLVQVSYRERNFASDTFVVNCDSYFGSSNTIEWTHRLDKPVDAKQLDDTCTKSLKGLPSCT